MFLNLRGEYLPHFRGIKDVCQPFAPQQSESKANLAEEQASQAPTATKPGGVMHCMCVTCSQLTTGICPRSCLGFGAVPASNNRCWNNAVSSSRRFRMMEFNENWSRKEKYAKSFSYCFMGIYRDKAPYITTRTLTGVLCISLCPPCTLWLLGSGPPQYRYRNSGAGCGAAPLPPRDAGHGLCSCLPRLHSGFVGAYVALEF